MTTQKKVKYGDDPKGWKNKGKFKKNLKRVLTVKFCS